MHRAILILALLAHPLWSCCPFDPDTLASEAATMPGFLDLIAGRIERLPAGHYRHELEAALKARQAEPDNFEHVRRAAEAHDMLLQHAEGLQLLEDFPDDKLSVTQRALRDGLRARLYIHQWHSWIDPVPETAHMALTASATAPQNRLLRMVLEWAANPPKFGAQNMLPDYFGLRFASNKTALGDNDQLRTLNLAEVPEFLAWLLRLHPSWENLDTYYALSLALGVMGKQHLAYFARLRAFEFLDQQKTTRLPVPADVRDLRALMIPRQFKGDALVEIPTLSEETKKSIAAEYEARREDARRWLAAREAFAMKKMAEGKSPTEPAFWQDFSFAAATLPAPSNDAPPAANEAPGEQKQAGMDTTLIVAAVCSAAVVVVVMATMRRKRKPEAEPKV